MKFNEILFEEAFENITSIKDKKFSTMVDYVPARLIKDKKSYEALKGKFTKLEFHGNVNFIALKEIIPAFKIEAEQFFGINSLIEFAVRNKGRYTSDEEFKKWKKEIIHNFKNDDRYKTFVDYCSSFNRKEIKKFEIVYLKSSKNKRVPKDLDNILKTVIDLFKSLIKEVNSEIEFDDEDLIIIKAQKVTTGDKVSKILVRFY